MSVSLFIKGDVMHKLFTKEQVDFNVMNDKELTKQRSEMLKNGWKQEKYKFILKSKKYKCNDGQSVRAFLLQNYDCNAKFDLPLCNCIINIKEYLNNLLQYDKLNYIWNKDILAIKTEEINGIATSYVYDKTKEGIYEAVEEIIKLKDDVE
jgi:hypothetical protein